MSRVANGTEALLVAGGSGARMAASGADRPKPLVEVGGRSLISHNLYALAETGLTRVHLAYSHQHPQIEQSAAAVADELGVELIAICETEPLGSVGSLAEMKPQDSPTLVVNADNLTALDLAAVVGDHRSSRAAMTQAVHVQQFHMPFGEIELAEDGTISAYREKPTYEILVSSAITVVSPEVVSLIDRGEFLNLPLLANRVLDAGLALRGHRHDSAWIDVNDLDARARAEELLSKRAYEFSAVGISAAGNPAAGLTAVDDPGIGDV